jgi:hypothetical protein
MWQVLGALFVLAAFVILGANAGHLTSPLVGGCLTTIGGGIVLLSPGSRRKS